MLTACLFYHVAQRHGSHKSRESPAGSRAMPRGKDEFGSELEAQYGFWVTGPAFAVGRDPRSADSERSFPDLVARRVPG